MLDTQCYKHSAYREERIPKRLNNSDVCQLQKFIINYCLNMFRASLCPKHVEAVDNKHLNCCILLVFSLHALFTLHGHRNIKLGICYIYCISTSTIVARTHLNASLIRTVPLLLFIRSSADGDSVS